MKIDLRERETPFLFKPYELVLGVESRDEEDEILRMLAYWRQYAAVPGFSLALDARIKAR